MRGRNRALWIRCRVRSGIALSKVGFSCDFCLKVRGLHSCLCNLFFFLFAGGPGNWMRSVTQQISSDEALICSRLARSLHSVCGPQAVPTSIGGSAFLCSVVLKENVPVDDIGMDDLLERYQI